MPEHIRAFVVVMVLGSLVWMLVRPAMVQIISPETFKRWRWFWYATTCAWFLSHSFWIYVVVMIVLLRMAARQETHVFGLYLLLLLTAPPAGAPISGLGVINYLFTLDHYRLLALAFLLPCAWRLAKQASTVRFFRSPVDWMVIAYLVLESLLAFRSGNLTSDARAALMFWIDLFLPYYVASRSIKDAEDFRHALAGLAVAGVLLAVLAVFEVLRNWKLYDSATAALGLNTFGAYKTRGGLVRPSTSVIDSIVLGYVMVVATGAYLYLQSRIKGGVQRWMGWMALVTGVLAALSRGPWVGLVLLLVTFMLTSPRPIKSLFQGAAISAFALLMLSVTPGGQQVVNLLPFVGEEEQGNVEYRANLLTVSLPVIEQNLLFGSLDYMEAPELQAMRQGEGIIDLVNTYVIVALHAGMVGLIFFAGMFVVTLIVIRRGMRWARRMKDPDALLLGRALLSCVLAIMFIIFTVSNIYVVPTLYFAMLGVSGAYFLSQQARARARQGSAPV